MNNCIKKFKSIVGFFLLVVFLCFETNAKDSEVVLKEKTYEGYIEYFKKCNEKYISSRSEIKYDSQGDKKIVYLTFDDGPNKYYDNILEILRNYNVKATFFITHCDKPSVVKKIKDEGHGIAIHSATHSMKSIYKDEMSYLEDLYQVQKYVYDTIGEYSHYLRFPGGSNNATSKSVNETIMSKLVKLVRDIGFEYYDWGISSADSAKTTSKEQIIELVVGGLNRNLKSNIVLMHDLHIHTIEALPTIIEYAKEKGFVFDVINDNTYPRHFTS